MTDIPSEQLNAARGRLRTILHNHLWQPITRLLTQADCNCRKITLYDYEKSLTKLSIWPLEKAWREHSASFILHCLDRFNWEPESKDCTSCSLGYNQAVRSAVKWTENYFHGLCLDCMETSKNKLLDEEYYTHNERRNWSRDCRITHGEPSWYFSFMGRKAKKGIKRKRENTGFDDNSYLD